MINTLGCLIIVTAIKLNLDTGVLMSSISDILRNLPMRSVQETIRSIDLTDISDGPSLTSIIQEVANPV